MTKTVVSHLPSYKFDGGLEFILVLGRTPVGIYDKVTYKHRDRIVGERYVFLRKVFRLSALEDEDLEDFVDETLLPKNVLWSKLESVYQMPIPAHFELSLIGLSKTSLDKSLPDTLYRRDTDSYEGEYDYILDEELDDEYEEELDLPQIEKITKARSQDV